MTSEEISNFVDDAGEADVIAELVQRGYYVRQLSNQPTAGLDNIVNGSINLMDAHGIPKHGVRVKIETLPTPKSITINSDTYQIGQIHSNTWYETNAEGKLLIPFVKGTKVRVHIENSFSRELTVPTSDFDVITLSSTDEDAFITPQAPYSPAIRRN